MVQSLIRWFRHFLRPKVTTVQVHIFENSVQKSIERYSNDRQLALLKSIEALFDSREQSQYWFEADIYEFRSCAKTHPSIVCLTCYKEDVQASSFKRKVDIPHRFRRKLFDTVHQITPAQVSQVPWPTNMSVKFSLLK